MFHLAYIISSRFHESIVRKIYVSVLTNTVRTRSPRIRNSIRNITKLSNNRVLSKFPQSFPVTSTTNKDIKGLNSCYVFSRTDSAVSLLQTTTRPRFGSRRREDSSEDQSGSVYSSRSCFMNGDVLSNFISVIFIYPRAPLHLPF